MGEEAPQETPDKPGKPSGKGLRQIVVSRVFTAQVVLLVTLLLLVVAGYFLPEHLGSFVFSLLVGCIGGSVALSRRVGREGPEAMAEVARSWITTLMPLLHGGLMAGVAYLLFISGILTGDGGNGLFTSNLFPNFVQPEQEAGETMSIRVLLGIRPGGIEDLGKLWVWCFVAGYSEKFVTGILGTLEKQGPGKP